MNVWGINATDVRTHLVPLYVNAMKDTISQLQQKPAMVRLNMSGKNYILCDKLV